VATQRRLSARIAQRHVGGSAQRPARGGVCGGKGLARPRGVERRAADKDLVEEGRAGRRRARARRGLLVFSGSAAAYLLGFGVMLAWAWLHQPIK
jgi:hypothetical protein